MSLTDLVYFLFCIFTLLYCLFYILYFCIIYFIRSRRRRPMSLTDLVYFFIFTLLYWCNVYFVFCIFALFILYFCLFA